MSLRKALECYSLVTGLKRRLKMKDSLLGMNMVITGATSGIGLAAAVELARRGAYVIGVGRSQARCLEAEKEIKKVYPQAKISFLIADLSSLSQVRELAGNIKQCVRESGKDRLDVLVNNAGTVSSWYVATGDGFELQFAVNHLAPFLLTHELLPLLMAAPAGRVINVSSGSHYRTRINWNDIMLRKHYNCLMAYKQTKLCNVLFSTEFNRKTWTGKGIRAYAVDPGLVNTDIGLKGTTGIVRWFWKKRSRGGVEPAKAAASIVHLACVPSDRLPTDVYWKDCKPMQPSPYSQREDFGRRLWEVSEKMCGIQTAQ